MSCVHSHPKLNSMRRNVVHIITKLFNMNYWISSTENISMHNKWHNFPIDCERAQSRARETKNDAQRKRESERRMTRLVSSNIHMHTHAHAQTVRGNHSPLTGKMPGATSANSQCVRPLLATRLQHPNQYCALAPCKRTTNTTRAQRLKV